MFLVSSFSYGLGLNEGRPPCGAVRPGRGAIVLEKPWLVRLAGAADAKLLLHLLERGPDLLHRLADLVGGRLQRSRPEVEGLGLHLDFRRIGRRVFDAFVCHGKSDRQSRARFLRCNARSDGWDAVVPRRPKGGPPLPQAQRALDLVGTTSRAE